MSTTQKSHATRIIDAPAHDIFVFLADPNRHRAIDSSGMLHGPHPGTEPITRVGQTFTMRMHHPQLGHYEMINTVISFDPDVEIGWAPAPTPSSAEVMRQLGVGNARGHTFTYQLRKNDDGETAVTQTYDWSGVEDPTFAKLCPFLSETQLAETLNRIATEVE